MTHACTLRDAADLPTSSARSVPSSEFAVPSSTSAATLWRWMHLPSDVVFAVAALLMARDFLLKLGPLYPGLVERITRRPEPRVRPVSGE
jgi:hypothetical protein